MSSAPDAPTPDLPDLEPGEKLGPLAFVGIGLGASTALLLVISWMRSGGFARPELGSGTGAVGAWTLIAAPVLLGLVAGLCRPKNPVRSALKLVLLCMVVAAPALGEGLL